MTHDAIEPQAVYDLPENTGCESCRFFVVQRPDHDVGFCLRFPPSHPREAAPHLFSGFPEVEIGMWCGEYQRREPKENQ